MTVQDICELALKEGVTISFSGKVHPEWPIVQIEVRKGDVYYRHRMFKENLDGLPFPEDVIERLIHEVTSATKSVTCELCGNKVPHLIPIFKQERGEFHKYNVCPECEYKHATELAATRENFHRQFGDN